MTAIGEDVPREQESTADLVTVVIPARNEEQSIAACVQSVLRQDYPDLQVIVVDGASTDRTDEIVLSMSEMDQRVELLRNPAGIIPTSLNLALAAARGRWLVRIDAHATVPPEYIRIAVEHLRTQRWGGVGGRKDGIGFTPAGRAIAAAMASPFGVGNSTYHYGSSSQTVEHVPFGAYPVDVARELGGWDEQLRVNQDFEFDYRIRQSGRELLFDPRLVIDWHCRQSTRELFQQYRRYGRGKVKVASKHPASLRVRHLAAPALVASWFVAAAVVRRRPVLAGGIVVPYALAVVAATAKVAPAVDGNDARRHLPGAFVAMHAGWGLGFWSGVRHVVTSRLRGQQPR